MSKVKNQCWRAQVYNQERQYKDCIPKRYLNKESLLIVAEHGIYPHIHKMKDLNREITEFVEDKLKDAESAIREGRLPKYALYRSYFETNIPHTISYTSILFPFRVIKQETEAVANHFRLFLESQIHTNYRTRDITERRWNFIVELVENATDERSYNVVYEPVYSEPQIWGRVMIRPLIPRKDPLIKGYFDSLTSLLNVPTGFTLDQVLNPEDYV